MKPPDSYTVLWTQEQCRWLQKVGDVGKRLKVAFGGPHGSQPSLTRYGVSCGDFVYPISVRQGDLYIVSRMTVKSFITFDEYLAEHLKLNRSGRALHPWELADKLLAERPELGHMLPTGCISEVAIGKSGLPIRLDRQVPSSIVTSLRFQSQRGERGLKHVVEGKITKTLTLQGGYYRLHPDSAAAFASLIANG